MKRYNVLSLDGGGIRGVLSAVLLSRLENACPGFLSSVDLIAGTSTGGILALGLAAGLQPDQIRQIYENSGSKIFSQSFWDEIRDLDKLVGADYNNTALKNALIEEIGDIQLSDLKKKVLISSFDLDNASEEPGMIRTWKPKFFHNFPGDDSDGNEKLVDVALRTSAAPTYFPIYQGYVDGGVVANNPSMCALAQAIHKLTGGQTLSKVTLISVGTGAYPSYLSDLNSDWGLVQWAPHLITLMMDGGSGLVDYQCQQILGSRYIRVNPILPRVVGMDAYREIPYLKQVAEAMDIKNTVRWIKKYYPLQAQ